MTDALVTTISGFGASFGLMVLIFLPLERLFPAREQGVLREESGTDFLFFAGQYLLWTAPVVACLTWLVQSVDRLPLSGLHAFVQGLPFWIQAIAVVALCDVSIYWAHRWSHRNAFLWRFHRVHHTAERLDFVAAYREHPFDNLYTRTVENLPAILLGFPLHLLAGFAVFRGLWAMYIHSNVALEPGPLRMILGSPRLHHWHHEKTHHGRVNFANLSPLMDLMFGTYHDPGHMPKQYGIPAKVPHGYVAQLVGPLLPRARPKSSAPPSTCNRREGAARLRQGQPKSPDVRWVGEDPDIAAAEAPQSWRVEPRGGP